MFCNEDLKLRSCVGVVKVAAKSPWQGMFSTSLTFKFIISLEWEYKL